MYTDYFGFREKPFGVTPDPRFFYMNPCYQEAYASLLYGIHERRGFIVLTGEVGTGKTTLLRRLMQHMQSNVRFVFFYNITLSFDEILDFICQQLGLPIQETGRLHKIGVLNQALLDQLARAGTVALLIDEAQHLGAEVLEHLRLLSNLETTAEKLLQIVLVGQPELESKLAQPELRQVKQRIAIQCRLQPLHDEEVGPFIDYRLNAVGSKHHHLFLPNAVQAIAYYSKGYPRLINILCDNALLIAYATSQKRVTAEIIAEAANDLQFKGWERGSRTAGRSRYVASEVGPKPTQAAIPARRADHPQKAYSKSRRTLRATAAVLFLGMGGVGLYLGQISGDLIEGVQDRLGTWQKTLQDTFSGGIAPPERRGSPLRGDQISSGVERMTASTAKGMPASTADVSTMEGRQESRDSYAPGEETRPRGGERLSSTTQGGNDEVSPIGSIGEAANWREKPIVVPPGSTIAEIAANTYGAQRDLGLDLIKEYNSQIENLNRVRAGQRLWLPPLSQETLVRQQPDGSYRLLLAAFRTFQQAEHIAQLARLKSYDSVVRARPVSKNLVLHRVEINGLANLDAVDRAREIAIANHWVPFADNRSGKRF